MLYPLRFQPLFKEYLWGGRRLGTLLAKPIGDGPTYAESWEAVDHGDDQSVVAEGPLAGRTLHQIVDEHGEALFGKHYPQPIFPLLFKYLDAKKTLSVQVHPNDEQGAKLDPPDLGKTEAWVVLASEPGSQIYAGLKPGTTRESLAAAIESGTSDECLHAFEPQVGDCVFIEAGTVHALGEGLVIAEIQQASNTTFRLFDWNRVDAEGKSRPLHIEESLEVSNYARGPVDPQTPEPTAVEGVERLVECDKFILERAKRSESLELDLAERFHLISVLDGDVTLTAGDYTLELKQGQTVLVPAACEKITLAPNQPSTWLDMYLP
ncbi:type I phosphomannose isomerase catalytic subunit [Aeoliella mucimassa]|uniref:Phosphohexomutase n=1 Tax=Aeoliella mucimassa TaxID=2527972 RepID=A0A518ANG1_9BACT|nr:type I phosphomannose isomerase catalytic subunit [Aeoliella mucimassa]QDU56257.1 putative mannose-6-phosphate isomerase GmuF [Aeoliella mucimassa]